MFRFRSGLQIPPTSLGRMTSRKLPAGITSCIGFEPPIYKTKIVRKSCQLGDSVISVHEKNSPSSNLHLNCVTLFAADGPVPWSWMMAVWPSMVNPSFIRWASQISESSITSIAVVNHTLLGKITTWAKSPLYSANLISSCCCDSSSVYPPS